VRSETSILSNLKRKVRDVLARRLNVPEIPLALERLRGCGYVPHHIFDVGAHAGEFTKLCRQIWPTAKLTCFEVLPHRVKELQSWCARDGNADVIESLLGAEAKRAAPLHEMESASSVLEEHISQASLTRFYPMKTIDEIVRSRSIAAPDLLKLDVQGYELEVLKGAQSALGQLSVILAEINLIDIHKNVPLLDDIVIFMRDRGFVAYDICGLTRRPLDKALWQADFIFVPMESALRSDKRWQL
jgi:FkbM family methyltransferase